MNALGVRAIFGLRIVVWTRAYRVASSPEGLIVGWTTEDSWRLCNIGAARGAQARRWRWRMAKVRPLPSKTIHLGHGTSYRGWETS